MSGSGYQLTSGSSTDTGTIYLYSPNTYSGGTDVVGGIAQVDSSSGLGTGAVTVDSGASLLLLSSVGTPTSPSNSLTLSGSGASGTAGALEDYSGGSGRSGSISLVGSTTIAAESSNNAFSIAGVISGTGPIAFSGGGSFLLSAESSYSGSSLVESNATLKTVISNQRCKESLPILYHKYHTG